MSDKRKRKVCQDCKKSVKESAAQDVVICGKCYRRGYDQGMTLNKNGEWYHGAEH